MSGSGQDVSADRTPARGSARPRRAPRVRRPRIPLLPDLLLTAVELDPSATALSYDGALLTYAELDSRSSRLARALIGRGLGPDDVVAVAMPRSDLSVQSVWGIAKSGATFAKSGGGSLVGGNLLDCHPEPSKTKLKKMLAEPYTNAYTIEKNGVKKLIYQTPWLKDGRPAGLVELSLEIPAEMPHFVRKPAAPNE